MRRRGELTPLRWSDEGVVLLDQRLLPREETWIDLKDPGEVATAIRDMVVRGAPAIGISAAFGLVLGCRAAESQSAESFDRAMEAHAETLLDARPTAVNLHHMVDRMQRVSAASETQSGLELRDRLLAEARTLSKKVYCSVIVST